MNIQEACDAMLYDRISQFTDMQIAVLIMHPTAVFAVKGYELTEDGEEALLRIARTILAERAERRAA